MGTKFHTVSVVLSIYPLILVVDHNASSISSVFPRRLTEKLMTKETAEVFWQLLTLLEHREKKSLAMRFKKIEEPPNVNCNKRPIQALPRAKQLKKMKFSGIQPSLVAEKEIFHLRDSLTNEKTRCFDLDNELKELKSRCTCWKEASAQVYVVEMYDARAKLLPRQGGKLFCNLSTS
ncbi:Uncharacterized protein Fot_15355 [Forsythia ovata]|uniref:Uncharacterized protein n=1 Tax=Forsythia ovata TaxID=205694 RepID=A0ABD1W982_9LAMI